MCISTLHTHVRQEGGPQLPQSVHCPGHGDAVTQGPGRRRGSQQMQSPQGHRGTQQCVRQHTHATVGEGLHGEGERGLQGATEGVGTE